MRIAKSFKNIGLGIYNSFKRFPLSLLLSTSVAVMIIITSELQPIRNQAFEDMLERVTMILALGVPLTLCVKLYFEKINKAKLVLLIPAYVISALLLVFYYFFLLKDLKMVSITRYIGVSIVLYLAFLYIPYLLKKEQFEMYVIKVFTGFFITVIYSVVLYIGLSAILFAINKLLGVRLVSKVYFYTWLFVVCVFAPSYFLALVPLKDRIVSTKDYPKLLRILLLYIVIPLITAYTVILYIYFVKIILTRQWPVGLVSHLVLWYSVIVAVVLFFITPVKDENTIANKFIKWFPGILIPNLLMMFISMGIRINAYGITENRYWVFILGLWVLGIMIYYLFTRKLLSIVLPLTLSIVALISVFGPISSYSISKMDQNRRFQRILERNNMIKDGRIVKAPETISKKDEIQISSILGYFNENHSLVDVKYLPKNFKISDTSKTFGFEYQSPSYTSPNGYFYFTKENADKPVNISGYDYLFDTSKNYNPNNSGNRNLNVVFSPDSSIVKIYYDKKEIYSKDFNNFGNNLVLKYGTSAKNNTLPSSEMTFTDENSSVKVKFIFNNISGNTKTGSGKSQIQGIDFYLLIRIKS